MVRISPLSGIITVLFLLAVLPSSRVMTSVQVPASESDWPTFRGNVARTGVAADAAIDTQSAPSWQIGGFTDGFTDPVIAAGVVVVGVGDAVYRRQALTALDILTGELRWTVSGASGDRSPATIADGMVFTASGTGDDPNLTAFDLQTGQERWSIPMRIERDTSPAVSDETIVVTSAVPTTDGGGFITEQALLALDLRTGEERWRVVPGGSDLSSPTLAGNRVYLSFRSADMTTGTLMALDAETGQTQWLATIGIPLNNNTWPVVAVDLVFVSTQSGLQVFDAVTGTERWRFDHVGIVSAPAVENGIVYIGSRDDNEGKVIALDAMTGQVRWQADAPRQIVYPPIKVGSVVVAASDNGHSEWSGAEHHAANLSAFDANTGKSLGETSIGDIVVTELTVANGSIVIGVHEGDQYLLRAIPLTDVVD